MTAKIPRVWHAVSIACMGVLTVVVVLLVLGFAVSGPEDNLAGVLLVVAAVFAVPLLIALGAWSLGLVLQRRAPRAAFALVVASTVAGGFGVLLVAAWFLPTLWL